MKQNNGSFLNMSGAHIQPSAFLVFATSVLFKLHFLG